jgi:sortase A
VNRVRLIAVTAGALVVAGVGAAAAIAATPTTTTTTTTTTTATPAGSTTTTTTTTTLPPLPVPENAPADNELEPQTYHGRIRIPSIEVDSPLLEGIRINTLDYGPGHWPGTALPGELGNVVVAGHRTSHNADFRRLDELEPGDQVIFDLDAALEAGDGFQRNDGVEVTVPTPDVLTGSHVYVVHSVQIVTPDAMWVVSQDYRHSATLFACHPPGSVSERIVAFLDLVDPETLALVDPPRPTTTTSTTTSTVAAA